MQEKITEHYFCAILQEYFQLYTQIMWIFQLRLLAFLTTFLYNCITDNITRLAWTIYLIIIPSSISVIISKRMQCQDKEV